MKINVSWLKDNGYDGLYNDGECGCTLEDLILCGEDFSQCVPGYKTACPPECVYHKYHITGKEEEE